MPATTGERWDWLSRTFDFMTWAQDRRQGGEKRRLFAKIQGKTLLVAVGTGNDLKYLPSGYDVVAIDISPRMIARAHTKAIREGCTASLIQMDAQRLAFADHSFETVLMVCTLCSVPNPVESLQELHRVLRPGGRLLMFEHVRSTIGPLALCLDFMTFLTRKVGPDLNRDTIGNLREAGFHLQREENVYLDIVKAIEATK